MRGDKTVVYFHTIVELLPMRYTHTTNCHHHVLQHTNPVFRTMLCKDELRDFKKTVSAKHGDDVKIRQPWRRNHINVKVFYAPEHFNPSDDTLKELEAEIYFHLQRGCIRSHLPITPTATINC
ncbi:MAG: hypothetical protein JWN75_258 [Candidatus Saccharibacteria bacterium]|nr:hypothetical protein [Candidatus Saccharibacteria bacterium]